MTDLEILDGMIELLSDPAHWTQKQFARDKDGKRTSAYGDAAVCWCIDGAAIKVGRGVPTPTALYKVLPSMWNAVVTFNDDHTHDEVMAKLREARALEAAKP